MVRRKRLTYCFPGGYFDRDMVPHYYLTDWQGNNVGVHNGNGKIEQQVDYYPYGEPWLEPEYTKAGNGNRYLFGGKERQVAGRANCYDFLARSYVAPQCRFSSIDPLAENTPWLSPYIFCASNPVNFIDPDGRRTHVVFNAPGEYKVIGGVLDDDNNIYEYFADADKKYTIMGPSIGRTTSITSFYISDEEKWAKGSIIKTGDFSGIRFINHVFNNTPPLDYYMWNARNKYFYDFKETNGEIKNILKKKNNLDHYRGMPVGIMTDGKQMFSSARDIGNYIAGYMAGIHGLPWDVARLGFDAYESWSHSSFCVEGVSTQNEQKRGWIK